MSSAPDHKRQRLRKGTTSCWECKRRKVKCEDSDTASCRPCIKRGSHCVSQELPEEHSLSLNNALEASTHNVYVTPGAEDVSPSTLSKTAKSIVRSSQHNNTVDQGPRGKRFPRILQGATQTRHHDLARLLYDALPSQEDTEILCAASFQPSVIGHEFLTKPYEKIISEGLATPDLLKAVPGPDTHPVLLARYMLLLAMVLQHFHARVLEGFERLSESPKAIMERIVQRAAGLVTTNDALLGTIEGLQCVMIESIFQANGGNLRRSWVTTRRAITIAQLMGLHRSDDRTKYTVLDQETEYDPHHMWFRLVFQERYLCLMLGLPQSSMDRSLAVPNILAQDHPIGYLERCHCVIASRIIERNELRSSSPDVEVMRAIDQELQSAARNLPRKWWLVPKLEAHADDPKAMFWDIRRLFAQVLHYNLLNQLHLPYMLSSHSGGKRHEYSQMTCANASREVLSRFVELSHFNEVACSCRSIDFLALMAAMTLLLAHLDGPRSESSLLAHQYHSDRAMIEQVQENMEEVDQQDSDAVSLQGAQILRQLLSINLDATSHYEASRHRVSVVGNGNAKENPMTLDDAAAANVHIPYFGTIRIARDGITKETTELRSGNALEHGTNLSRGGSSVSSRIASTGLQGSVRPRFPVLATPSASSDTEARSSIETELRYNEEHDSPLHSNHSVSAPTYPAGLMQHFDDGASNITLSLATPSQPEINDQSLPNESYPSLAAGMEDWALQGVDMAFFDSLIRDAGD